MIQYPDSPNDAWLVNAQTDRLARMMQNRLMSTGQALASTGAGLASNIIDKIASRATLKENLNKAMSQDPRARAEGLIALGITPPELIGKTVQQQIELERQKAEARKVGERQGKRDPIDDRTGTMDASMDLSEANKEGFFGEDEEAFNKSSASAAGASYGKSIIPKDPFKKQQWLESRRTQVRKETDPIVAGSRSVLGVAGNNNLAAARSVKILENKNMTMPQMNLVFMDIARIMQGGAPTENEIGATKFNNIYTQFNELKNRFSDAPQSVDLPKAQTQLRSMVQDLIDVDNETIKQGLDTAEVDHEALISQDPKWWKNHRASIEKRFILSPGKRGGDSQTAPQGNTALSKMSDAELLKALGQ